MPEPLWRPSAERIAEAAMTAFQARAARRAGRVFDDYFALHAWSVAEPAAFWSLCAEEASLPFDRAPRRVMSEGALHEISWFEGATLNYAEALLFPACLRDDSQPALIGVTEEATTSAGRAVGTSSLSYAQLRREVAAAQRALRNEGVGVGDRVAAYAANVPETVVLLLACAGLGAIFTSCSPEFGVEAATARFSQVRPKVLAASTAYRYGGRRFDTGEVVRELVAALKLERAVVLPYPGEDETPIGMVPWREWLGDDGSVLSIEHRRDGHTETGKIRPDALPLYTVPLPFDHPLYILYSSGTTGLPKAIVHRAGGVLLSHHKEHRLHSDIRPGDRVLYFSTCGWMMWNWLVSVLAQAATAILYDGSPVHPDPDALWRLAERHQLTFFGTSARYLHGLQSSRVQPRSFDLGSLRTIASTGSPLTAAGYEYVYREVKADVHLASISGGTDIVGCFMLGVPTLPVYAGQIQAPGLGVDLASFDDEGKAVRGRPGELVCRSPLPSMPLGFWNDSDGERYRSAYFEHFPGVWRHGDLIQLTPEGGVVVLGRSDATLNPGGVRIGTAEIYRPLEGMPEIVEAAAVGKRVDGDEHIWLLVVLAPGVDLTEVLIDSMKRRIRSAASPRHVPKRILAVSGLPRTRSGKSMELAVARVVNGLEVPNEAVVANPESLAEIAQMVRGAEDG